jgi:hypothetical protein
MADRTSIVALAINCAGFRCTWCTLAYCRSCFIRRSTFSTPTTASSTNPPMAMVRPPSVIVLIDSPKYLNTRTVTRIDTGMAVSEISVVRRFARKRKSTIATTTDAATSLPVSVEIDASMKDA